MTASARDIEQTRQRVLARFGEFALQSEDLDAVLMEACRLVSEALGTKRAKVLEIEAEDEVLFVRAGVGWASDVVGKLRLPMSERSSETFSIRERVPIITQDIRTETRFEFPDFLKAGGVVAIANVPVVLPGGTAYGLLQVDATEPREFGPEDTEFLRTYASLLGGAIGGLLKTEALRASEERFRSLHAEAERRAAELRAVVESMPDAVYMGGVDGITLANQPALDQLGFTSREELNRHVGTLAEEIQTRDAGTGAPIPTEDQAFARALRGERVVQDVRVRHLLSGEDRVVRCAAAPVIIDGQVIAAVAVNTDVTDRRNAEDALRKAEEQVREREARQAFLLRLNDALRAEPDADAVANHALQMLSDELHLDRCYVGVYRLAEDRGDFTHQVGNDRVPAVPEGVRLSDFPAALQVAFDRTLVIEDVAKAEGMADTDRENLAALGMGALVAATLRKGEGRPLWSIVAISADPRRWTPGEVALIEEVTERTWAALERARAEGALRESEERFRAIVETATNYAIFTTDAEGRIEIWPKGAEQVFGWTAEEAVGQLADITYTPEDRDAGVPEKERQEARATGEAPNVHWHIRKDGTRVFIDGVARLFMGPGGKLQGFLKVGQDVTERRATEEALRESEERFRQFGDASADVLWIRNAETLEFEYISPAVEEVYGVKPEDLLAGNQILRWVGMILPEDRELALDHIRRVRDGEHALNSFRILRRSDGKVRWIRDTSFPLRDAEGRVQRIGGIGHDATQEVELHDRLHVLVAELQHRTRNLMGVVRSVTDKTLATSTSLADFQGRIRDRLNALVRVNSLLSRLDGGSRITFGELLLTELLAHGVADPDDPSSQVRLEGPDGVRLRSSTVQTLALGVHELATNALKYGALSRPEGRLAVSWKLMDGTDGTPRLRVDWRESGVPMLTVVSNSASGGEATAPRRRGYGRELIERALPYQLKAETTYEITPSGVHCSITLPISSTTGASGTTEEETHA